ncbi:tetratricopeptide (TPR) repeat protein [Bradyrhizobium japonicum]|uniref:Tetratricopeptide (TPR) repeat protein n=1 Tax=Bradyrhizobium japonicum TaxID=375 RepID=A0ABV2S3W6_BRAJP|nr:pentapeptide repeat-containing protein [Bradyrhizobium japonicum]UQE01691.1 pentapeptide repeat-containing protein [Bradyrhizobium japonicum]WLB21955.1 pentapeptide repeat-containing protein [Bradyrhizobium japonicum]
MTTANQHHEPYPSMDALRRAHEYLFDNLPTSERSGSLTEAGSMQIEEFISRAIATGAVLDTLADRREAQGLVDYWVASTFTQLQLSSLARGPASKSGDSSVVHSQRDPEYQDRPDNQLEPFNPAVVDAAAERGDAFIRGLSAKQTDLVRRVLLGVLRFPDHDQEISSRPARREELNKFGKKGQVDELLDGLKDAGILVGRPTKEGEELSLQYLALSRRWGWLAKEIDKRKNLSDLALSWIGSNRSTGALLDWRLIRRFREYGNLKQWETDFINASSRWNIIKASVALAVAIVIGVIALASTPAYEKLYVPLKFKSVVQEIKDKNIPDERKADDIRWLATYHQQLEARGLRLAEPLKKDLHGIAAAGAQFRESKLRNVVFERATLSSASFEGSVLENINFRNAKLDQANFDGVYLCKQVDFSGADIAGASFKRMKFWNDNIPIFAEAPWWQAKGWGFEEIDLLEKRYPRKDIGQNDGLKSILDGINFARTVYEKMGLDEEDKLERLASLNNRRAWTLATYGLIGDGEAEAAATAAMDYYARARDEPFLKIRGASTADTLAYILMQKPAKDDAEEKSNFTRALALLKSAAETLDDAEVIFRYAVALHVLGQDEEAIAQLQKALPEKEYEPTHELLLLNKHFTGTFKKEVVNSTATINRTTAGLVTRCATLNSPN